MRGQPSATRQRRGGVACATIGFETRPAFAAWLGLGSVAAVGAVARSPLAIGPGGPSRRGPKLVSRCGGAAFAPEPFAATPAFGARPTFAEAAAAEGALAGPAAVDECSALTGSASVSDSHLLSCVAVFPASRPCIILLVGRACYNTNTCKTTPKLRVRTGFGGYQADTAGMPARTLPFEPFRPLKSDECIKEIAPKRADAAYVCGIRAFRRDFLDTFISFQRAETLEREGSGRFRRIPGGYRGGVG